MLNSNCDQNDIYKVERDIKKFASRLLLFATSSSSVIFNATDFFELFVYTRTFQWYTTFRMIHEKQSWVQSHAGIYMWVMMIIMGPHAC